MVSAMPRGDGLLGGCRRRAGLAQVNVRLAAGVAQPDDEGCQAERKALLQECRVGFRHGAHVRRQGVQWEVVPKIDRRRVQPFRHPARLPLP
jgi:hypothetical protein